MGEVQSEVEVAQKAEREILTFLMCVFVLGSSFWRATGLRSSGEDDCPVWLNGSPRALSDYRFAGWNPTAAIKFGAARREWPLNDARRPHFRVVRVALGTAHNGV